MIILLLIIIMDLPPLLSNIWIPLLPTLKSILKASNQKHQENKHEGSHVSTLHTHLNQCSWLKLTNAFDKEQYMIAIKTALPAECCVPVAWGSHVIWHRDTEKS